MSESKIPAPGDWRRQGQEKYLSGVKLEQGTYTHIAPDGIMIIANFAEKSFPLSDGDLMQGYSTEDRYHWICDKCFNDFRDEFNWN